MDLFEQQDVEHIMSSMREGLYFTDLDRVITHWNGAAERITGYSAQEVVGHSCNENILMHVDEAGNSLCEGRCPLSYTMEDEKPREVKVYLHHKDGHRLPVMVRSLPRRDVANNVVGGIEIFTDLSQRENLEMQVKQLEQLSMVDPLTELPNRRYLESRMEAAQTELVNNDIPWGILFFDVDKFKRVNDTYGHLMGDKVLIMVSKTLSLSVSPFDTVARWGGEEMAAVFPNVNKESLFKAAERLRILVENSWTVHEGLQVAVTVSIGGTMARKEDSLDKVLDRVDGLMYESKEGGRNRTTLG